MRDRSSREGTGERGPERARGVALHYQEVGRRAQEWKDGGSNQLYMPVRILFAGTTEAHRRIGLKPEFAGIESGVLVGEHERGGQAAIAECVGDWRQFYRFRSGTDDQPYVGETQSSP